MGKIELFMAVLVVCCSSHAYDPGWPCSQQVLFANTHLRAALPKPLPVVRQDINGKCGPSTLAMAASYFRRALPMNCLNPYELADTMTVATYQVGRYWLGLQGAAAPDVLSLSILINSAETLAATARALGLYARAGTETLGEVFLNVLNQEVVLIHWAMGTGWEDGHWSAVQEINSAEIHLRDPWPSNPIENVKEIWDFSQRSLAAPGFFSVVRVSDRPL
jgi:hypothetical protein